MTVGVTMASWERIVQVYRSNKHNFYRIRSINSYIKALLHAVIFNIKKILQQFSCLFSSNTCVFPHFPHKNALKLHTICAHSAKPSLY